MRNDFLARAGATMSSYAEDDETKRSYFWPFVFALAAVCFEVVWHVVYLRFRFSQVFDEGEHAIFHIMYYVLRPASLALAILTLARMVFAPISLEGRSTKNLRSQAKRDLPDLRGHDND
jgi:hypothetical protein